MAKDKEYIVICLSVGGLNNKIFHSQDKVKQSNFAPGIAEELVKSKFLAEAKKISAEDVVALIEEAKTVEDVNSLMDGETRQGPKKAAINKIEEIEEAEAADWKAKTLETVSKLTKVEELKAYQSEEFSEDVIDAANQKIDDIYIESISALKSVEEVEAFKGESFSEDVNAAADLKIEELKGAEAGESSEESK